MATHSPRNIPFVVSAAVAIHVLACGSSGNVGQKDPNDPGTPGNNTPGDHSSQIPLIYPYAREGSWLYSVSATGTANFGSGSSTTTQDEGYFRVDLVSSDSASGVCDFQVIGFTTSGGTHIPSRFSTRASAGLLELERDASGEWSPALQGGDSAWMGVFFFVNDVGNDSGSEVAKHSSAGNCNAAGQSAQGMEVTSSYSNLSDQYAEKVYDVDAVQWFAEGIGLVSSSYSYSYQDKSSTTSWAASNSRSSISLVGYRIVAQDGTVTSSGSLDLSGVAASAHTRLSVVTLGQDSIELTWNDDCLNESSWIVEMSSDGGDTFTPIATLPADTTRLDDTETTILEPLPGLYMYPTYVYRVKAHNAIGDPPYSNVASSQAYGPVSTPTVSDAKYMNVNVATWPDPARYIVSLKVDWTGVNAPTQKLSFQYSADAGLTWKDFGEATGPFSSDSGTTRFTWSVADPVYSVQIRMVASNPWGTATSNAVGVDYCVSC
jgi:hypothetical protein